MTDSGAAEVVLALFSRPFYAFQGGPFAFLLELKIASQLRKELARRAQENGANLERGCVRLKWGKITIWSGSGPRRLSLHMKRFP